MSSKLFETIESINKVLEVIFYDPVTKLKSKETLSRNIALSLVNDLPNSEDKELAVSSRAWDIGRHNDVAYYRPMIDFASSVSFPEPIQNLDFRVHPDFASVLVGLKWSLFRTRNSYHAYADKVLPWGSRNQLLAALMVLEEEKSCFPLVDMKWIAHAILNDGVQYLRFSCNSTTYRGSMISYLGDFEIKAAELTDDGYTDWGTVFPIHDTVMVTSEEQFKDLVRQDIDKFKKQIGKDALDKPYESS